MDLNDKFLKDSEIELAEDFFSNGYIVRPAENPGSLNQVQKEVINIACDLLEHAYPDDPQVFLNNIHSHVTPASLNEFRSTIYQRMNVYSWFRPTYFKLARDNLSTIVGNELAMQNRINFSIQLPNDDKSLLDIHSDTFSGETPFQIVQWVPLVNAYDSKGMFILPPADNREIFPKFKSIVEDSGISGLFKEVESRLKWIDVSYGEVLIFSPNLLHGNIVNETLETRWSMNSRFTGLFTPYMTSEKGLGNFYLPITTRPVSDIGLNYQDPEGFSD